MQLTTLVLIRHAEADTGSGSAARLCGWYDPPLTAKGRAQVIQLERRLASEVPGSAVYASPLRRAVETSKAAPGAGPRLLDALREISCGQLDGKPLAEVESGYPHLWCRNLEQADEHFRWPGGESYREFRERALGAIGDITARHRGERVIVVTHAGVISQLICSLHGFSPARWGLFRPGFASVTELEWAGTGGVLRRFDDRGHLAALAA